MNEEFTQTLRQAGYSVTKPREIVFSALRSGKPRSMRELTLDLSSVIDRASIYRTVSLFERLGIVVRVQTGWKYKVELSDKFAPHHHHLTCVNCGRLISFDEPDGLTKLIDELASTHGFTPKEHYLEISGLCAQCR